MNDLRSQQRTERSVEYWRALLRRELADNSTVDFYDMRPAAIDNLALIAAHAVVRELAHDA